MEELKLNFLKEYLDPTKLWCDPSEFDYNSVVDFKYSEKEGIYHIKFKYEKGFCEWYLRH